MEIGGTFRQTETSERQAGDAPLCNNDYRAQGADSRITPGKQSPEKSKQYLVVSNGHGVRTWYDYVNIFTCRHSLCPELRIKKKYVYAFIRRTAVVVFSYFRARYFKLLTLALVVITLLLPYDIIYQQ